MSIAQLPPQNHINALRSFLGRLRRNRSAPSLQEIAHAEDSVGALETSLKTANNPPSNNQ